MNGAVAVTGELVEDRPALVLASEQAYVTLYQISQCGKIVGSKSPRCVGSTRGGHQGVILMQMDRSTPSSTGDVLPPKPGMETLQRALLEAATEINAAIDALSQDERNALADDVERVAHTLATWTDRIREHGLADERLTPEERAALRQRLKRERDSRAFSRMLWGVGTADSLGPRMGPKGERVYFLRSHVTGLVKIGTTKWPRRRLLQLKRLEGGEVELLGTIAGGRDIERDTHKRFAADRVKGEWFRLTDELVKFIQVRAELHRNDEPRLRRRRQAQP